jgi:acyl carrier protein
VGSDLSANAIRALSDALPRAGVRLPPVRLLARPADDFSGLEPRSFDTVILNSVVQYFPSAEYLERVVAGAVESVADGGAVFLGDLRALGTLGALHAAVELAHAPDALPVDELRRRVARRRDDEEELVLDPRFFAALRARVPRLAAVEVLLKRGVHHNELTRHRYDVVLRVGPERVEPVAAREITWGADVRSVADVVPLLDGGALRVTGIPDARVAPEVRLAEVLADADPDAAAEDLRGVDAPGAIDPEAVWALGDERGMKAVLRPSPGLPGCFDAAFVPAECDAPAFADPEAPGEPAAWTSDPGRAALLRGLVPELRAHLRDQLPEYMVPAALLTLDALPRSVSGKLDRRALPDPEPARVAGGPAYVAPRTPHEEALCALWSELLRVDRVGVEDGFFDLGGHSLLATVLVGRIREAFGVEMPLHQVFQTPTVAGLAAAVDEAGDQVLARLFAELDDMSDDEARALLALEAEGLVG